MLDHLELFVLDLAEGNAYIDPAYINEKGAMNRGYMEDVYWAWCKTKNIVPTASRAKIYEMVGKKFKPVRSSNERSFMIPASLIKPKQQ